VTLAQIRRCSDRLVVHHGPRRFGPIRDLVAARQAGPALGDSVLEGRLLAWLREAGLPDPVTQFRVSAGPKRYRFDAAYPDLHIGIEMLGWYEHGKRSAMEPDLSRRNRIGIAGWLILEFAAHHSRSEIIDTIIDARAEQQARIGRLTG
jgi:hypothetical protein